MNTTDKKLDLTSVTGRGGNSSTFSEQDKQLFTVLHDVVQPGNAIEPDVAAETINKSLLGLSTRSKNEKEDADVVEGFLDSFWLLFLSVVEHTPYNNTGQDRLLATIQSLLKISEGSYKIWQDSPVQVWADLPLFGPCVREKWGFTATPGFNKPYHEMKGATEWINMNAFMARLFAAKVIAWEKYKLPVWSLREAWEEPFDTVAVNDIRALVTAQWVIYAGGIIYRLSEEERPEENPRLTKGGSLFDGESGFNRKRWSFWKKRAEELTSNVSDEGRSIACTVVETMSQIEGK